MTQAKMIFGSKVNVVNLTADVTNGNVGAGTIVWTNTDLAPYAVAEFYNPGTFGAAPTDNSTVDLYLVRRESGSPDEADSSVPTTTDVEAAEYMGSFLIYDADEAQRKRITVSLNGVQAGLWYIFNNTGQTITGSGSNIYVNITPFSYQDA